MSVTMKWNGDKVKLLAEKAAGLSAYEMGLVVEGQAKLLSPKKTGRLGASITTASGSGEHTDPRGKGAVSSDRIKGPTDIHETFVGTPVDYGPYMEYGTIKTDAQPFLRPALDIIKGKKLTVVETISKKGKVIAAFGEYLTNRQSFSQTNEGFSE